MVEHLLDNSSIDILVVTGTWLNRNIDMQALVIENHKCDIRLDRDTKAGGGLLIYHKNHLIVEEFCELRSPASTENSVEQLWAKVKIGKGKPLLLGGIYKTPYSPLIHHERLESTLVTAISTNCEIIILEDLNCDLLKPDISPAKDLMEIISSNAFRQ